jgi:excisionase family DNA binding protein
LINSDINLVLVCDENEKLKSQTGFIDNKLEWLTSREAALFLRVSVGQLRNMVWRRQVKFYKLGRKLRFSRRDIEKLLRPAGME